MPGAGFLMTVAVALCMGIGLGVHSPWPPAGLLTLAAIMTAVGVLLHRSGRSALLPILIAVVLLGMTRSVVHCRNRVTPQALDTSLQQMSPGTTWTVSGTVMPPWKHKTPERDGRRLRFRLTQATVTLDACRYRLTQPVSISLYGYDATPHCGERWQVQGKLSVRRYRLTDQSGSVGERVAIDMSASSSRAHRRFGGWQDWLDVPSLMALRHGMSVLLSRGIEDDATTAAVVDAMFLGYRSTLPDQVLESFRRTGTAHVFAISGLHIGIVATLIVAVLRLCRVSRVYWVLLLGPALVAYAALTGGRPSAVRACVMAICYFAAPFFGRRPNVLNALAMAVVVIVVAVPSQLWSVSFIYSFVVVAVIIMAMPVFDPLIRRCTEPDAFQAVELQTRGGAWRRVATRYLLTIVAISSAAWLGSAPLTAYFFGRVSLIALPGNLLAVPLAFLTILTCILSVIGGSCLAFLGIVFNHTNVLLVHTQIGGMAALASVPFASLPVPSPPMWMLVGMYAALACAGLALRRRH